MPAWIKCPYCNAKFQWQHEVNGHIRVKHPEKV